MNIFDKMHCMKKFYAYTTKNLLRTTNPENVSLIGQILLKISFFKGQNNSFWENEPCAYSNRNSEKFSKQNFDKNSVKNKTSNFLLQNFRFSPTLIGHEYRLVWELAKKMTAFEGYEE